MGGELPRSISAVKRALTVAPVLVTLDRSKPFILQTDASAYGLGYVLSQLDSQGEENPITFCIKEVVSKREKLLSHRTGSSGQVKGVQHFRTYLEGNPFTIQTDHNPLIHLNNVKDSHGRLARWALTHQPYNFTVKHRSGKANSNADGLSRDPSAAAVGEMSEPP